MKKYTFICCVVTENKWTTLHIYCLESKGYGSQGRATKDLLIVDLLRWPIERNGEYQLVTRKKFNKLSGREV